MGIEIVMSKRTARLLLNSRISHDERHVDWIESVYAGKSNLGPFDEFPVKNRDLYNSIRSDIRAKNSGDGR